MEPSVFIFFIGKVTINMEYFSSAFIIVPYITSYNNKKAQHRSWHTAKCNKLYHLKWNINAWDTALYLHGRHFVRHLGICKRICAQLPQLMPGVITHNSVIKRSLYINKWLSYSQLLLLLLLLHIFITRYRHPSCLATLEWIWRARQCTINNLPTVIIRVPFSSKGVNHMAYLAHVATVIWCVLLFV